MLIDLDGLGFSRVARTSLDALSNPALLPARVATVSGKVLSLVGPDVPDVGTLSGALASAPPLERPAVGDWVAVRVDRGAAVVHRVLSRSSLLARKAPGRASSSQPIAANVDVLFIVTAVGADLSARRVERFVVLARAGGVRPVAIVNKADLDPEAERVAARLGRRLAGLDVVATTATSTSGADALAPWLEPRSTVAFVGSSGVGKSTLVNRVVGGAPMETGAIREGDDKGRHTTTRRALMVAPSGVIVIDTPGLREVGLWADAAAVAEAFDDVEAIAASCRFRDCRHAGEPGCAVVAAVTDGSLDAERLAARMDLQREAAAVAGRADRASRQAEKQRHKALSRMVREVTRAKGRRGD